MKFAVSFIFVSIYLHLTGANITSEVPDYIGLIKFIRSYYSTSSVFVLHPENKVNKHYEDLIIQHIIFDWARLLHREEITTACGTFKNMIKLTEHYENLRPLIIVFIPGRRAVHEFANHTMKIKMSLFVWFLVFVPTLANRMHDYCYHPPNNMFNLMLDTEMLVMCPGDYIIREWYSVDGNTTEIFDFIKWHREEEPLKFEILTNLSLYERRNDLRGRVLNAVTVKNSLLIKVENRNLRGYFSNVIKELQNILNFTIGTIIEEDIFGTYNTTTGRWNGALNVVATGQVDFSLCGFSMNNLRLGVVDFTIPITTLAHYIYVKQPQVISVKWFAYYKAFSFYIWMCIITVTVITPFVSTFIRYRIESTNPRQLIYEEFMRIWSIFCQQGITDIPRYSSLRIVYLSMLLTSLVMTSAYSASLISFLTGAVHDVPFRSIDEFLNDGSYRIIVERSTSDHDMFTLSRDSLSRRVRKVLRPPEALPRNTEEGFRMICNDPKLGFYTIFKKEWQMDLEFAIPCKISGIDFGRVDSICLILPKDSQYTAIINYHLQKLLSSGVLNRKRMDMNYEDQTKFEPVSIFSAASALIIFAAGVGLALIVLITELYFRTALAGVVN